MASAKAARVMRTRITMPSRRFPSQAAPRPPEPAFAGPAAGPTLRPNAAQLLSGGGGAPLPGLALQRSGTDDEAIRKLVRANMEGKSHDGHGGTRDRNEHAAAKGYGQDNTERRLAGVIENAQRKRAAEEQAKAKKK